MSRIDRSSLIASFTPSEVGVRNYAPMNNGRVLGQLEQETVWSVFYEALGILESLKIRYWISAGTALGIHREGGFIKHDTDLDVEVYGRWGRNTREQEVQLQLMFHDAGFILKRTQRCRGKLQQLAFLKEDVIFDIYFFYDGIEGDNLLNFNEHGIYRFKKKFLPIQQTETVVGKLWMPSPPDEYMEWRYGVDWKTPKTVKVGWIDDCTCLEIR